MSLLDEGYQIPFPLNRIATVQTQVGLLALSAHRGALVWGISASRSVLTPLYGLMLSRYRRGAGAWSMLDQSGSPRMLSLGTTEPTSELSRF